MQQLPIIESFRFEDEDDYEYKIFRILSSVRAPASVFLAGKRDSRRHSTVERRLNEVPRDWKKFFVIWRVRYIEKLHLTNFWE